MHNVHCTFTRQSLSTSLHHTVLLVPWNMEVSLQRIEFCVPSSHYPVCTLVSGQCAHHRFAGAQYLSFTGGHNICASYHLHWILCICKHCKMCSTQLVALNLKSPEERHVPLFEHSLYNICTLCPLITCRALCMHRVITNIAKTGILSPWQLINSPGPSFAIIEKRA